MSTTPLAITVPPYHVQSTAEDLRAGFPYFSFHESVSALWATKWRAASAHGIYPFMDGRVEDFDPIFAQLVQLSGDDPAILYRPDDYAKPFLPAAEELVSDAERALSAGESPAARDLYLRAAAVYRIARFPINRSNLSELAWRNGKAAYEKGAALLDPPSSAVEIPFVHAETSVGDRGVPIQAYLRFPTGETPPSGWPLVLFICGLDAYRTDNTPRTQAHVDHGCATLSFEIPGTGDCPAAPNDPSSPDRLMSSMLDWVEANASNYGFDPMRVVARGISTGGYYAFRIAHTHGDRLFAAVAQGGGSHHMFDGAWIGAQNQMEYPYALADALAYKFGYRDADLATAIARYQADAPKFSLVDTGVLGSASCKLLAINGMEDSIFPIEDNVIVATSGKETDLIARAALGHMGNPGAEEIINEWIGKALTEAV